MDGVSRLAKRLWIFRRRSSTYRMNALSLLPPGFKGVERGCGSSEFAFVIADVTDEGGGESMKPPD
jgi:hypothetical protein